MTAGDRIDSIGRRQRIPRQQPIDQTMPVGEWTDDIAPCVVAPDLWFAKVVHPTVVDICDTCTFKVACAKAAIAARAEYGMWAGVHLDLYGTAKGRTKALRRVIGETP